MSKLTVTVWGNVATEPMHVVSGNGMPRTSFRLASTPRRRRDDGSYGDGPTSFFSVTCFGHMAVNVADSVHKGEPVVLQGEMTVREWQTENGRSGKDVDLVALHIGPDLRWGRTRFMRAPRRSDEAGVAGQQTPVEQPSGPGELRPAGGAAA